MKIRIELFGALREADARGHVELDMPAQSTVADLREALRVHLAEHAPGIPAGLVGRCAFAGDDTILQNRDALPEHGRLAILPPVSGG